MPINDFDKNSRLSLIRNRHLALLTRYDPSEGVVGLLGSLEAPYDLSTCPCPVGEKIVDNPQSPWIREDIFGRPVAEENLGFTFGYGSRDTEDSLLLDSEDDCLDTLTIGERIEQMKKDYDHHVHQERINLIKERYAALHKNDETVPVVEEVPKEQKRFSDFLNRDRVIQSVPSPEDLRWFYSVADVGLA